MQEIVGKENKTKTPYCVVRLASTEADMFKDINSFSSSPLSPASDFQGYYIGYDIDRNNKCCAIIFLNEETADVGVLTHEAVHVSIGLLKHFKFSIDKLRPDGQTTVPSVGPEEFLALCVETIVKTMYRKLEPNGNLLS